MVLVSGSRERSAGNRMIGARDGVRDGVGVIRRRFQEEALYVFVDMFMWLRRH
jgi:hypothetical protein